jgi:uncharacterized protein YndB with AHSA1/START domain
MPTLESPAAHVPTFMLTQTRVIRAPRGRVYEAWTNPEVLKQWFGPANMYCPEATLDVRVGGEYRIAVDPTPEAAASAAISESEQRHAAAVGSYTKIVPNELLQFSWSPNWNLGEQSLVTLTFKDVEGGTELTLLHENFNTEESRDGHNKGWAGSFDKLARILEA